MAEVQFMVLYIGFSIVISISHQSLLWNKQSERRENEISWFCDSLRKTVNSLEKSYHKMFVVHIIYLTFRHILKSIFRSPFIWREVAGLGQLDSLWERSAWDQVRILLMKLFKTHGNLGKIKNSMYLFRSTVWSSATVFYCFFVTDLKLAINCKTRPFSET